MRNSYNALHGIGIVLRVLSVVAVLVWTGYLALNWRGFVYSGPMMGLSMFLLYWAPAVFICMTVYGIGALFDAVWSIEKHTRFMADYMRQRSKPKAE